MPASVVALFVTRLLESMLYCVEPVNLPTFMVVPALFLAVVLVATYGPARRASAVDPMMVLRQD